MSLVTKQFFSIDTIHNSAGYANLLYLPRTAIVNHNTLLTIVVPHKPHTILTPSRQIILFSNAKNNNLPSAKNIGESRF